MNWTALMKPNRLSSWIALEVWCFCEYFNIKLPWNTAPWLFGVMMGKQGRRVDTQQEVEDGKR